MQERSEYLCKKTKKNEKFLRKGKLLMQLTKCKVNARKCQNLYKLMSDLNESAIQSVSERAERECKSNLCRYVDRA